MEITAVEQNKEKRIKRNEDSFRDLRNNIKHTNIWILGVPAEERERAEKIFEEIIAKNIPNMGKETRKFRTCRVPHRTRPRRHMSRHIVIKLTKIKGKEIIVKVSREKNYKGIAIRLSADFSAETLQDRREWHDIVKMMRGINLQLRILYPVRLSFIFSG